jgi:hypothetical protein
MAPSTRDPNPTLPVRVTIQPKTKPSPFQCASLSQYDALSRASGVARRRREFITLLGGTVTWPLAPRAQEPGRKRRIDGLMLQAEDDPESTPRIAALVQGLQQLNWSTGRNLQIDIRWGAADAARSRAHADEVVE